MVRCNEIGNEVTLGSIGLPGRIFRLIRPEAEHRLETLMRLADTNMDVIGLPSKPMRREAS